MLGLLLSMAMAKLVGACLPGFIAGLASCTQLPPPSVESCKPEICLFDESNRPTATDPFGPAASRPTCPGSVFRTRAQSAPPLTLLYTPLLAGVPELKTVT